MSTEAEVGVLQPSARERLGPEAGRGRKGPVDDPVSWILQDPSIPGSWPPAPRAYIPEVFSRQVHENVLKQCYKANPSFHPHAPVEHAIAHLTDEKSEALSVHSTSDEAPWEREPAGPARAHSPRWVSQSPLQGSLLRLPRKHFL